MNLDVLMNLLLKQLLLKLNLLSLSAGLSGIACIVAQVVCNGLGVFDMSVLLGLEVVSNLWLHGILWHVVEA